MNTKYAGELYLIVHRAYDFDDQPITPATSGLVAVRVKIVGPTSAVILTADMTWDEPNSRWVHKWRSPSTGGTYKIRCSVWSADGEDSFEIRRLRLETPSI